ncbi:hypothetical protein [Marinomonas algicola]|uniref:hypothetical protein n=1 Tax=Marinomonas algicola TaxID=2773454 RepID=UPI00174D1DA0|nr:hypothetical protein [Marinomonas algicola]
MALIKESDLRSYSKKSSISLEILSSRELDYEKFDVFLSHSYLDKDIVFRLKNYLEEQELFVYVDWIDDKQLECESVNSATAEVFRKRMTQCQSLLFATSTVD